MANALNQTDPRGRQLARPCASIVERESTVKIGVSLRSLLGSRVNTSPSRLIEPGPQPEELDQVLTAAASAPDHGRLTPWRFVIVPLDKRTLLANVFALALIDRAPGATLEQIEVARQKAYRAPLLMLAVMVAGEDAMSAVTAVERLVSLGCAIQNILLAAHSMGYGSGLASGQALSSDHLRELFFLQKHESAACFISIGSVASRKPVRIRPHPAHFVSSL